MVNNFRKYLCVIGMLSISACSTMKTNILTVDESNVLKEKSLIYTTSDELPDFPAQTAVNVQFGVFGVATAISNGNEMVKNNNTEAPAIAIAKELAKGLSEEQNIRVINNKNIISSSDKINDLVQLHNDYDLILDVRTIGWGSIYYVSDWDNYKVMYNVHARLIDQKTEEIIAEEVCSSAPEYKETDDAPSYESLENGNGLNQELLRSVDYCIDHIRSMAKFHHSKDYVNQYNTLKKKNGV